MIVPFAPREAQMVRECEEQILKLYCRMLRARSAEDKRDLIPQIEEARTRLLRQVENRLAA